MCKNEKLMVVLMWIVLMGVLAPATNAQGLVTDGLVFWLDASKPGDLELSGNNVSRWSDGSGNDYYAEQTDPALQPIYAGGALNGKGVVDFGDSIYGNPLTTYQPWMQFRDASGGALNISNVRTVFWVAGMDEGSNGFLLGDDNNYHFHRGTENQIWDGANGWAHANIRDGSTYLNGVEVDGTATVLPTDYSIISLVTTGNVETSALTLDRTYRTGGIKLGELLIYDRPLTDDERVSVEAYLYQKWMVPGAAFDPQPADGATDVPQDVILSWEAGVFAVAHDVYFGAAFDDVNNASRVNPMDVLVSQGQAATTYALPAALEFGQTYYWRVDEVNAAPDNTIFKGEVWSFTVEPLAYPVEGVIATSNATSQPGADPENMVNGSGLNENDEHSVASGDMWLAVPADGEPITIQYEFAGVLKLHQMLVWNYNVQFELMLGFGIKDVTVEYSEDGADWTVLADVQLAQGIAKSDYTANTTIDFGGVAAKYVRLIVNSGYGFMGQFGLSEVRFLSIPVNAREPQPADGATDVGIDAVLGWRSGREAVSHEVYLGTDPNALALADTVADTSYAPGDLMLGTTYSWSITEVNEATSPSVWAGSVWSFTTQGYVVVEDFESYTDDLDAGGAIFQTWIDGWDNGTGSTVGHLNAPFAEQTIVHGGGQSMPLFYDNTSTATSETERTFDIPMNWAASGIKALSLAFAGDPDNDPASLYLKVNGTRVDYGGATTDLKVSGWLAWTIDMSSLGGNLSNITSLVIGIEGAGAAGVVYVDDIRLYPQETEMIEPAEPDPTGLAAHYTFDSDFQDSSGNGNHAEAVGSAVIANDPTRGGVASLDGLGDAIRVPALGAGTASEVTISLWVNTDVAWTGGYLSLFHCDGWTAGEIHMHVVDPGQFNAGVAPGLDGGNLVAPGTVEVNEWYHVAFTASAAEVSLYVNGIRGDTRVPTPLPDAFIFGEGHLGAWLNGTTLERYWTGQIDEVRFYDRALSYSEVAGLAGRTTPLYKPF